MIFFDGTYRLPEDRGSQGRKFRKTASAWRIRIINLSLSQPEIHYLRPYVVVATQENEGFFKGRCADVIGKRICRDFSLEVSQILWVEQIPSIPTQLLVAEFKPKYTYGRQEYYTIHWRPILDNELEVIQAFVDERGTI